MKAESNLFHEECGGRITIETTEGKIGSTYHCDECGTVHPTEVRFPKA